LDAAADTDMGLETGEYISDLIQTNPITATDPVTEGSDHLRLVKKVLLQSFPGVSGAVTLTHTQLNDAALKSAAQNIGGVWTFSNDTFIQFRNSGDTADIGLIKISATNVFELGNSSFQIGLNASAITIPTGDLTIPTGSLGVGVATPTGLIEIVGTATAPSGAQSNNPHLKIGASGLSSLNIWAGVAPDYELTIQGRHQNTDDLYYPIALNPLGGAVTVGSDLTVTGGLLRQNRTTRSRMIIDSLGTGGANVSGLDIYNEGSIKASILFIESAGGLQIFDNAGAPAIVMDGAGEVSIPNGALEASGDITAFA
jgi:hypothetical protein